MNRIPSAQAELACMDEFKRLFGGDDIRLRKIAGFENEMLIEISNGKLKCFYDSDGKFLKKVDLSE